jgi:hypothetical protein
MSDGWAEHLERGVHALMRRLAPLRTGFVAIACPGAACSAGMAPTLGPGARRGVMA